MRKSEGDLRRRNSEKVLSTWKAAAAATSEEGSCFFLDQLVRLQRNYSATYGATFDAAVLAQAVEFGSTLQRTRLVECIRLRDLLWPFVPWLVGLGLAGGSDLEGISGNVLGWSAAAARS